MKTLKHQLLFAAVVLTLVGCGYSPPTSKGSTQLPRDMIDAGCELIQIDGPWFDDIYLIKCEKGVPPGYVGTSTGQQQGKSRKSNSVHLVD